MEVAVEATPGPDPRPRAFRLGTARRAVEAVIDRWPGRDHLYLKVRAGDGGIYLLRRERDGRWRLWLYRSTAAGPPLSGD
ncbi:MAG TPA: hypothetical protein VKA55_00510 [Gammaproteobacteria bacterium]|nr:hypothetical protein [Gammaproteobacteria bacterium]